MDRQQETDIKKSVQKNTMKLVVLDGATMNPGDLSWKPLESLGELVIYDRTPDEKIVDRARDAHILLTNKCPLSAESVAQLPLLKFVSVTATGFNVVDLAALKQRGIPVSNVPEYSTDSVGQMVFAGLLALIHQPARHDQAIRAGEWASRQDFSFWLAPLTELAGKTMGIVGLGRIGRRVAEIANVFGMNVWAATSRNPSSSDADDTFVQRKSIEELFQGADVVSIHCPQTDENQGFVNRSLLERMKPTAYFLNAARGGLVNEADLADALNQELLAGAWLDVASTEPIQPDNPLLQAKNCLLTPHYAWSTREARTRLLETTADNIRAFLDGSPDSRR